MPWQADTAFETGAQNNQASYVQQLLARTRGQQIQQESDLQQQRAIRDVPTSSLHPTAAGFGTPQPNGMTRFSNPDVLNHALTQGESARTRDAAIQQQESSADAIAHYHQSKGEPVPLELAPYLQQARSKVPMAADSLKMMQNYLDVKGNAIEVKNADGTTSWVNPRTKQEIAAGKGGNTGDFTPPAGFRPRYEVDETTGHRKTTYEAPPWAHEAAVGALEDIGWKGRESEPGYKKALYDAIQKLTPYTEGGGAVKASVGLTPPAGGPNPGLTPPGNLPPGPAPGTTSSQYRALAESTADPTIKAALMKASVDALMAERAGPGVTVTPQGFTAPKRAPDAGTAKDIANVDTSQALIGTLRQALATPEIQKMTGALWQNPGGAMSRMGGEGVGLPFGDTKLYQSAVPPEFAKYQTNIRTFRLQAQKVLEGLRANQVVLKYGAPAFASENDPPPVADAKLQAWSQFYQDHRDAISNVLSQTNRQTITSPTSTPAPGGSAASAGVSGGGAMQWVRDPVSKKLVPAR